MQRATFGQKCRATVCRRGVAVGLRAWPLAVATCLGLAEQAIAEDPNIVRYGTASASSFWSAPTYVAAKGNDNSSTSLWSSGAGDTAVWWQVDLGSAFRITRVQLQARQDAVDYPSVRSNFEIRGSNSSDGSGYTVLATQGSTAFAHKATWVADVSETAAFRFLRVAKTDAGELNFAEFRAYSGAAVINGSFETGNTNGWTVSSSDANPPYYAVVNNAGTAHGTYALELGTQNSKGNAVFSQTIATTPRVGHTLRLSFGAYANKLKDQVLYVEVLDGGALLASQTCTRRSTADFPAPATFTVYDLPFTAASAATTLRFTDQTTLANSNSCDGMLDWVELLLVNLRIHYIIIQSILLGDMT